VTIVWRKSLEKSSKCEVIDEGTVCGRIAVTAFEEFGCEIIVCAFHHQEGLNAFSDMGDVLVLKAAA
jgi:hypothetical protein